MNYHPGHDLHPIQAGCAGRAPWGWRQGIVRSYGGHVAVVDYVQEDGGIRLWHHRRLPLRPGTPVRVHEELHVLDVDGRWVNYSHRGGGLGAVPTPDLPELWTPERQVPITDLGSGEAETPRPGDPG